MAREHATGIDFGTSTSLVADQVGRLPLEIVPIGHSTTWLPSVAAVIGGALLVGEEAEDQPANRIIRSAKRAITENRTMLRVGNTEVDADKVIIALMSEIARRTEAAGQSLSEAGEVRLGCPAMWTGDQRERLLKLAAEAGLPVTGASLIDEPIAAGVAWATHRFYQPGKRPRGKLLVFDMGGGTLDIAVLDIAGRDQPIISVLSALGNAEAGDTLDRAIVTQLTAMLADRGIAVGNLPNPHLVDALFLNAAREAKVRLTSADSHRVLIRGLDLPELTYTREQLVVDRVFELTQGQPWLVNGLADEITFKMRVSGTITTAQIDEAKERLIQKRPVHLDALRARLYEPRVEQVIQAITTGTLPGPDASFDEDVSYVRNLGLIRGTGTPEIANPIYREFCCGTGSCSPTC